ncbi:MAG: hypothetical protein AB7G47_20750 [Mycolicibacterium sp.]|uniref:hypothetical protein n=1 Tax=Mycolicibacterium sp. TaxID=2320850 RepID=UPI003D0AA7C2
MTGSSASESTGFVIVAGGSSSGFVIVAGGGSSGFVIVAGGGSSGFVIVAGGGSSGFVIVAGGATVRVTVGGCTGLVIVAGGATVTVTVGGCTGLVIVAGGATVVVGATVTVCVPPLPAALSAVVVLGMDFVASDGLASSFWAKLTTTQTKIAKRTVVNAPSPAKVVRLPSPWFSTCFGPTTSASQTGACPNSRYGSTLSPAKLAYWVASGSE